MTAWSVDTRRYVRSIIARQKFLPRCRQDSEQIGSPDLLILFTNTVSHKMVKCAITEAEKCNADIVRCHTSSGTALNEILTNACNA